MKITLDLGLVKEKNWTPDSANSIKSAAAVLIKKCGFQTREEIAAAEFLVRPRRPGKPVSPEEKRRSKHPLSTTAKQGLQAIRGLRRFLLDTGRLRCEPAESEPGRPLADDLAECAHHLQNEPRRRGRSQNTEEYVRIAVSQVRRICEGCGFQSAREMRRPLILVWLHTQNAARPTTIRRAGYVQRFAGWLLENGRITDQSLGDLYPFTKKDDKPWYERTSERNWVWLGQYEDLDAPTFQNLDAILDDSGLAVANAAERKRLKGRISRAISEAWELRHSSLGRDRWAAGSRDLLCAVCASWSQSGFRPAQIRDRLNRMPPKIRIAIGGAGRKECSKIPRGTKGRERVQGYCNDGLHRQPVQSGRNGDLRERVRQLAEEGLTPQQIQARLKREVSRRGKAPEVVTIRQWLKESPPRPFQQKPLPSDPEEIRRELESYHGKNRSNGKLAPRVNRNQVWKQWEAEILSLHDGKMEAAELAEAIVNRYDALTSDERARIWPGHSEKLRDPESVRKGVTSRSKRDAVSLVRKGLWDADREAKLTQVLEDVAEDNRADGDQTTGTSLTKRGPKGPRCDPKADKQLWEAWQTRQWKTKAELATDKGLREKDLVHALERVRNRRRRKGQN